MESLIQKYNVSRETYDNLTTLVAQLKEWQEKFNLVSRSSLEEVWTRHIADSMQLFSLIPNKAETLYDLGSGAGFPALVLAVMAKELRPDLQITLIESITKKTVYLNHVRTVLNLENVTVINDRTENLKLPAADVITARAVAALDKLLGFAYPLCSRHTEFIFPKGRTYQDEINQARQKWHFDLKIEPNDVSSDGVILRLTHLRRK
jgi:16S rRNA (guanine527-N7)-methyltransferase